MSRRYLLFVYTRPVPGMDDEYNRWYNEEHLYDVLKLDGFEAAQRWVYDHPHPADGPGPEWQNVALYEVPEEDYERARASLVASGIERTEAIAAGRVPQVPISPALDDHRVAFWFTENSPRVSR